MNDVSITNFQSLPEDSLVTYAQTMWQAYLAPRHVQRLCRLLEKVESGKITRLITSFPPRHSKTLNIGQFFPAWYLGRNPTEKIIYATYGQRLANRIGGSVRNLMIDPLHQRIFPESVISPASKARNEFQTTKDGIYQAVGRDGSLTGSGANILIVDDIFKNHKEAESEHIRDEVKNWYRSTASTRLQKDGAVILNGTRWHKDDIAGWALKELAHEDWVYVNFPAIDENGKPLWPEMKSLKELENIKKSLGSRYWSALYQGEPVEEEGNIFKRKDWRFYNVLPKGLDIIIQSWDMTFDEGETNDYVVGQIWGRKGNDYYLIAQVRKKMNFTDTLKWVRIMSGDHPRARKKYIEKAANGAAVISALDKEIPGLIPVPAGGRGSKTARGHAVSYLQESGHVYLPNPALYPWVNDYIDELADFPYGKHDDQADATTQALAELHKNTGAARLRKMLGIS